MFVTGRGTRVVLPTLDGAKIQVGATDVADEAALAALLARIAPPVRGIIHAAGILDVLAEHVGALALRSLGLDPLMAVDLCAALARFLGRPLPATLAFDYPTVAALATHLEATKLFGRAPAPTAAATAIAAPSDDEAEAQHVAELDGRGSEKGSWPCRRAGSVERSG